MKEGTSAVLRQSCLDENGGLIPWNATAICEMSKDLLADGKTPYERRFGELFERTSDWHIMLFLRETSQYSVNLKRKCHWEFSFDIPCMRREFGMEIYWSQTRECKNQNFSGDGNELAKVPRAVGKVKSDLISQSLGICQSL